MLDSFSRTRLLLGKEAMEKLKQAKVLILGAGGVGSAAAEALVRSGLQNLTIADKELLNDGNISEQLICDRDNIGLSKAEALKKRLEEINPGADIAASLFSFGENTELDLSLFDLVLDTVEDIETKTILIRKASAVGVPVLSVVGLKKKFDPSKLFVTDLFKLKEGSEALSLQKALKKHGIKKHKVIVSLEQRDEKTDIGGKFSLIPHAAGLALGGEAVLMLSGKNEQTS